MIGENKNFDLNPKENGACLKFTSNFKQAPFSFGYAQVGQYKLNKLKNV